MSTQQEIRADGQIKKFCAYGFLKNMRFFEPFLLLFLMSRHLDLVQIGFLISIREITIQLFEIPSGVIADYLGRKKELYACFIFYIISFLCFAFCFHFWSAALAIFFFGLGEAFRSGTHKAFIYTYLDVKQWRSEKTYVYGMTRSYSLLGSALSALIGLGLMLWVEDPSFLFLCAVIPYVLDLLLIKSYPAYFDQHDQRPHQSLGGMLGDMWRNVQSSRSLWRLLSEEGVYESTLSLSKDFMQPMLQAIVATTGIVLFAQCSSEQNLYILLALLYMSLNLLAAYASRKAYLVRERFSCMKSLMVIHALTGLLFLLMAFFSTSYLTLIMLYIALYLMLNLRKPIWVDEMEEHTDKHLRASVLSVSTQLKSICLAVLAPALGYLVENYGFSVMMAAVAGLYLLTQFLLIPKKECSI